MYALQIETDVIKSLQKLPPKIFRQIVFKVLALQQTPLPQDHKPIGSAYRVDSGEYRVLYFVDHKKELVQVVLIANSNSQSKMMCASTHRLKPMADTQNLLKQVGERLPERVLTRFL